MSNGYQSKLAKPEVKPHFFWDSKIKEWDYRAGLCLPIGAIKFCLMLNRTYNPLKANK